MSAAEPIAAAADEAAARQSSSTPPLDALAPLPSAPPLDHANAFLDPTSDFSVDAFLLSRVSGSTLSQITAELDAYGKVLRSELEDVVDRDFRGFVALGTGLKSEAPRIARLAWQRRGSVAEMEDREEGAQSGVLGLDEVRAEVEAARDDIRGVEDEVRAVMRQREQVENQKAQLSLLLSFNDSLRRLEELLLIPPHSASGAGDGSVPGQGGDAAQVEEQRQLWAAFEDEDDWDRPDEASSEEELSPDTEEEAEELKHAGKPVRSLSPVDTRSGHNRRPSRLSAGRRSSYDPLTHRHSHSHHHHHHAHNADLPARIARASSEHATLTFLCQRALQLDLSTFVAAHTSRLQRVRTMLRSDLRRLVELLTRLDGASLLVNSKTSNANASGAVLRETADLNAWSHVVRPAGDEEDEASAQGAWRAYWEARVEEQKRWLSLALSTWHNLAVGDADKSSVSMQEEAVPGPRDAEDVVRGCLVEPWARDNIKPDSLTPSGAAASMRTPFTPASFEAQLSTAVAATSATKAARAKFSSVSLRPVHADDSDEKPLPLRALYNRILSFAAVQMSTVCEVVDRVGTFTSSGASSKAAADTAIIAAGQEPPAKVEAPASAEEGIESCDVFVNVLWATIGQRLMEELGGELYFVGRPEIFHKNYSISSAFLSAFASLAPSSRAVAALKQHPTYTAFQKRWQLPVYFQMRYREIVSRLEARLAAASGSSASSVSTAPPLLDASAAVLDAFVLPWLEHCHLPELAARQWRLSLQVLSRYKTWLDSELPSDFNTRQDGRRGEKPLLRSHAREHSGQNDSYMAGLRSSSPVASNVPSRAATPTQGLDAEAIAASDDAALRSLTIIAADAIWLKAQVLAAFDQEVAPKLHRGTAEPSAEDLEIRAALRETLAETVHYDATLLPQLSQRILSVLRTRCADPLRMVRSISTQYRGSATPSPAPREAEPSYFVPQILRPLRAYLGKAERRGDASSATPARNLDVQTRSLWASEVVEDVLYRYRASLYAMNKNYESLRRLKRGGQGAGIGSIFGRSTAGSAAESAADADADRMRAQMCADVAALERDVQELAEVDTHVNVGEEAWELLRAAAKGATEEAHA